MNRISKKVNLLQLQAQEETDGILIDSSLLNVLKLGKSKIIQLFLEDADSPRHASQMTGAGERSVVPTDTAWLLKQAKNCAPLEEVSTKKAKCWS